MAGLKLEYEVVKECMDSIQKLSADYPIIEKPSVSGKGESITEIEQLADLYITFYKSIETLSEETVKYFNSMITDFQKIDKKVSKKLNWWSEDKMIRDFSEEKKKELYETLEIGDNKEWKPFI